MKKVLPLIIATLTALFVLVSLTFREMLAPWLGVALNWAIVLSSVALLVALARFFLAHMANIVQGKKGFLYSLIAAIAFILTIVAGLIFGIDNPVYLKWIAGIMKPLQLALLGLLALVMASLSMKFIRERGWTPLTVSFSISAVVFLILGLGVLQAIQMEPLNQVIRVLEGLPMIGARGLLIGVALGGLLMGLRMLTGAERPYDD